MRKRSSYHRYTLLLLLACVTAPVGAWGAGPANVLVVINDNSPESREVGAYYVKKRKVPAKNVAHIKCTDEEIIPRGDYQRLIEKPVKDYLSKTGLNKRVDYLLLTKGVPIKLKSEMKSVDSALMYMDFGLNPDGVNAPASNPYFGKNEKFSRKTYGFYLSTRLDGYTVKDAKALVDRSLAARPQKGLFLIDTASNRTTGSYGVLNLAMKRAHDSIIRRGHLSYLDETSEFVGGRKKLIGYYSWGSNDDSFTESKYKSNRFIPGAIAETVVSTSARTFKRTSDGQSLIADLIEAGVTGVKGYVSEPYLTAIADPAILFDRYLSGYNLAESFYMASKNIFWKDIVIGDPLCAPYAGRK